MTKAIIPTPDDTSVVTKVLMDLVSRVPRSGEPGDVHPKVRARQIASAAARKAALVSGSLALPPGPFGLLTILPDLYAIWKIQRSMVSDIAATFGKSVFLTKETMIYCLFRHAGAAVIRDLVVRVGDRFLVRRAAARTLHALVGKLGLRVTERLIGKGISRWIPLIGALGVGAYAYYDTSQVAANAIGLFSKELKFDGPKKRRR